MEKMTFKERLLKYNSKKDLIITAVILGAVLIISLIALVGHIFKLNVSDWIGCVIGYLVTFSMFVSFLIMFISNRIKIRKIKKNSDVIIGRIYGHIMVSKARYCPYYEYYIDGKRYTLTSNIATGRPGRDVGDSVVILHNRVTGEAYCKNDLKSEGGIYLIFSAVGLLFLSLLIYATINKYCN